MFREGNDLSPAGFRLMILAYTLVWVALVYGLWLIHTALPWWVAFVLATLLVAGGVPHIRDLLLLFASDKTVRKAMDEQQARIDRVLGEKEH